MVQWGVNRAICLFSLLAAPLSWAQPAEVFHSATAGFAITKPEGWKFVTAQQHTQNLKSTKVNDADLQAAIVAGGGTPLVVVAKYPEPYPALNPNVTVYVRALGDLKGQPATKILGTVLQIFRSGLNDFQINQSPVATDFSGLKGAYMRATYTLQTQQGDMFPVISDMWLVPRGKFFFIIGMGVPWKNDPALQSEIVSILNSIKIDH